MRWISICLLTSVDLSFCAYIIILIDVVTRCLKRINFIFTAMDLARLIKVFYRRHRDFSKTPTYLFGQSYGGKVCPRLGYYLHTVSSCIYWFSLSLWRLTRLRQSNDFFHIYYILGLTFRDKIHKISLIQCLTWHILSLSM